MSNMNVHQGHQLDDWKLINISNRISNEMKGQDKTYVEEGRHHKHRFIDIICQHQILRRRTKSKNV